MNRETQVLKTHIRIDIFQITVFNENLFSRRKKTITSCDQFAHFCEKLHRMQKIYIFRNKPSESNVLKCL